MRPIVVNLFAGPGAGKSTTAAGVFYYLKLLGVNCELAREYAKDKVWEENKTALNNQNYIFGKQSYKLTMLETKVDVIITDSPLLNLLLYCGTDSVDFKKNVVHTFNRYKNLNYYVNRQKAYNPAGRYQDYDAALAMDVQTAKMLEDNNVRVLEIDGNQSGVAFVVREVISNLLLSDTITLNRAEEMRDALSTLCP